MPCAAPDRPWHWLRRNERCTIPGVVSAVAIATRAEPVQGKAGRWRHMLERWCLLSTRTDRARPCTTVVHGDADDDFWDALEHVPRIHTSHWLFGLHVGRQLTCLKLWEQLLSGRIVVHDRPQAGQSLLDRPAWHKPGWAGALICEDPPTWIKCRTVVGVINICDLHNYAAGSIEDFASAAGVDLPADAEIDGPAAALAVGVEAEARVVLTWVTGIMREWRSEGCGNWRPTAAGLAWSAYRHRCLKPRQVMIHSHERALELERSAYVGGRCIPYYVGVVKPRRRGELERARPVSEWDGKPPRGPVVVYDHNSLYPAVMARYHYPARLLCVRGSVELHQAAELLARHCLVAACLIHSPQRPYALRVKGETLWRTGRFWSVLTSPELSSALTSGHVQEIGETAMYTRVELFRAYVEWAWAKRIAAQDPVAASLAKMLALGLSGKFGQARAGWHDLPDQDAHGAWGTFAYAGRSAAGDRQDFLGRFFGRAVQEWQRGGETMDSAPAIAAHITAYARAQEDWWFERLPPGSLLYHDTDSLHVTSAGERVLLEWPAQIGAGLGQLSVRERADDAEYYGAKHYRVGAAYCLGSMSCARHAVQGGAWEMEQAERLGTILERRPAGYWESQQIRKHVDACPSHRRILPSGWTEPLPYVGPVYDSWREQARQLALPVDGQGQAQSTQALTQAQSAS